MLIHYPYENYMKEVEKEEKIKLKQKIEAINFDKLKKLKS